MKSGLEGRNNRYGCGVVDGAADVSMKSGLEGRNNGDRFCVSQGGGVVSQ